MSDDSPPDQPPDADTVASPTVPPPPPRAKKRWWHRWKLILAGLVVSPLLAFAGYVWITLHFSYSEGQRAGTLQKFSHKGWMCKTWEGELILPSMPGVPPQIWSFSVMSESVAVVIHEGLGKRVVVDYKEHRGVPTNCWGETPYYVSGFRLEQ